MAASPLEVSTRAPATVAGAPATKALVILNRKARHGRAGAGAALELLSRSGFELIEEQVDQPQFLGQAIRRAAGNVEAEVPGNFREATPGAMERAAKGEPAA